MSFDWTEYLELAQELVGSSALHATQEARQRAAISRAYYAAFCKCRNYLRDEKEQHVPSGGRAHQFVRDEFKRNSDKLFKRIGYNLERLRSDRNKADYDDDAAVKFDITAQTDLALAGKVISLLDLLSRR